MEVAALASKVAALETQLAAVKQPHLVHAETGEDLGRMLDWQTAWSEELGAPVVVTATTIRYSDPDCKGESRIDYAGDFHAALPDGTIVKPMGATSLFAYRSTMNYLRRCISDGQSGTAPERAYQATAFRLPPTPPPMVRVDLR